MNVSIPHILFIDDHEDSRKLVSFVLTRNNCCVILDDCLDKALPLARTRCFHPYLVDNWMPGGSGIDLCRKHKEFDRITPAVFCSGAALDVDKREARDAGARAYLVNPEITANWWKRIGI